MKGHIKQRSKGSWTLGVDFGRSPDGKRKQPTLTGAGRKTEGVRGRRDGLRGLGDRLAEFGGDGGLRHNGDDGQTARWRGGREPYPGTGCSA